MWVGVWVWVWVWVCVCVCVRVGGGCGCGCIAHFHSHVRLMILLKEWSEQIHAIRGYIGRGQENSSSDSSVEQLVVDVEKWRSALSYTIDSQDTKTMDQVSSNKFANPHSCNSNDFLTPFLAITTHY